MSEFRKFGSIPRLVRGCVVTEKIDGTNGCIVVEEYWGQSKEEVPFATYVSGEPVEGAPDFLIYAQSRNQIVTPGKKTDNHGFAGWVWANAQALVTALGPGYHYGEWWGQGVQRGYGLTEKRFSLFNTGRWTEEGVQSVSGLPNLSVVPVLYEGIFRELALMEVTNSLALEGSVAAPGFMDPEGIIVYHQAARQLFKYTLDGDGHKGG
jgi:hypothetical protein